MASLKRSAEGMESPSLKRERSSAPPGPALNLEGPLPILCVLDLDKTVEYLHDLPHNVHRAALSF